MNLADLSPIEKNCLADLVINYYMFEGRDTEKSYQEIVDNDENDIDTKTEAQIHLNLIKKYDQEIRDLADQLVETIKTNLINRN